MIGIFPKDDPKQTLRIKRWLMAFGSYLMWMAITVVLYSQGQMHRLTLDLLVVSFLGIIICNLLIYAIIRSGLNIRFKDPSLTLLQMTIATFWVMEIVYYADAIRSVVLLVYLVVFVYGLFKLNVRQFLFLSAFAVVNYSLLIFLLYKTHPESLNNKVDILNILILATVLPWFSLVGGYITGLRARISGAFSTIARLTDNVRDVIFVLDMNLHYTYVSPSVKTLRGYEPEEIMKQIATDAFAPSSRDKVIKAWRDTVELEKSGHIISSSETHELEVMRKDGTTVWTETKFSLIKDETQRSIGVLAVMRDITERKEAQETLRQSEERYRTIIENIEDGYTELDLKGNFIFFNKAISTIHGYPQDELMKLSYRDVMDEENANMIFAEYNKVFTTGESAKGVEYEIISKTGIKKYLETSITPIRDTAGRIIAFRGIVRDRTEHRQAEEALRQSGEKYRNILENTQEGYFEVDLAGNFIFFNDSMCRLYGYSKEEVMGLNYRHYTDKENASFIFRAFNNIYKTGEPLKELSWQVIRKDGIRRYVESSASLIKDSEDQPVGFRGIVRDITERKQMEEDFQRTLESLRKAVGATIQVMISAVEIRDPYTAGHQSRSADLARSIAREMGLPQEKIDGIRMACSIHDIGKLSVPAEILSKTTKLSDIEFALIKEHPLLGYEMLKNVESPWPLSQVVYQHHERMDGSGYPRHLKGDEIIIEARIMAVADVVEAMASYRPYRPALGIDAALAEIEKNKGILYDSAVVDACLRLFREKAYKLP
ncbi:MAG: hypothetical protein CVU55_07700 [Deltaproteobacteria bacterium HGW-Deltaproteobacteria-13]|jgi:PAS domain S-box-containing protein|nr:MAG: hypothetical protein CVU55_07700 [Deltaproteobacteria bacterium HGW-Deltaproteobacteria-13]